MTFIVQKASPSTNSELRRPSRFVMNTRRLILEFVGRQRLKATVSRLSENSLRDIGLTENDVTSIRNASFATEASELLRKARTNRAGNW